MEEEEEGPWLRARAMSSGDPMTLNGGLSLSPAAELEEEEEERLASALASPSPSLTLMARTMSGTPTEKVETKLDAQEQPSIVSPSSAARSSVTPSHKTVAAPRSLSVHPAVPAPASQPHTLTPSLVALQSCCAPGTKARARTWDESGLEAQRGDMLSRSQSRTVRAEVMAARISSEGWNSNERAHAG